jgi:uncharacterized protein YndB with AHSA1/START domain
MDTELHEVERYVDAPPRAVYRLVADIERMAEWSPETYRCVWKDGVSGPEVGARFKAWNRHGWLRWSNSPVVIVASPGEEFAFDRRTLGFSVVWRYTMAATGTGTTLRESYQLARTTPAWGDWIAAKVFGRGDRHAQLDEGMRQTLDRIAAVAEST